jgi:hypothetical protein
MMLLDNKVAHWVDSGREIERNCFTWTKNKLAKL